MPTIPQVDSCCFFLSTETGAKIIGFFELIFLGGISALGELLYIIRTLTNLNGTDIVIHLFMLAVLVFITILGLLLLLGVFKDRPAYVRLWINGTSMLVAGLFLLVILGIILWIIGHGNGFLAGYIVHLCLQAYFLMVVNSYAGGQNVSM